MPYLADALLFSKSFWVGPVAGLFFPPRCVACGCQQELPHGLCHACQQQIHIISKPACARCGQPFSYEMGEGAECGACLDTPPAYDKAWSVMRYDEDSRKLITRLKYADRGDLAPYLGRLMAQHGAQLLEDVDVLVPVPIHWRRMVLRRYNQSYLLAKEISTFAQIPMAPRALKRVLHTAPQASLERKERLENVKRAFAPHPKFSKGVVGKNVCLIDDVMTTGATIDACTKALKKAGAARIHILTSARRFAQE